MIPGIPKALMEQIESRPRIEYIGSNGKWTELWGHGCLTDEEAQKYVDRFNGGIKPYMRIKPKEPK